MKHDLNGPKKLRSSLLIELNFQFIHSDLRIMNYASSIVWVFTDLRNCVTVMQL